MAKKTVVNEVASALGAAAARVETTLKPKRTATAKHSKAKVAHAGAERAPEAVPAPAPLDRAKVALVAYLRWESRGFQGGSPDEDWVAAEKELQTAS